MIDLEEQNEHLFLPAFFIDRMIDLLND